MADTTPLPTIAEIEAAKAGRPEPDCRTCRHGYITWSGEICNLGRCTNGNRYEPLPPVRLWRKTC